MQITPCVVGPWQSQTLNNLSLTATNCPFATGGPRRTLPKGSSVGERCLHRSDGERQDYRLGGLLRWIDLAAHRFGGALQGMGRTLIRGACRTGEVHRSYGLLAVASYAVMRWAHGSRAITHEQ